MSTFFYNSFDDDLAEIVREKITSAKRRVYACFYILSLPFIIQALALAKKKKCDVKVVLSDDEKNIDTFSYLKLHHVPVKVWRQTRGQLHVKLLIVDDTALVGSLNPTFYGTQHNIELMIEIKDKKIVDNLIFFFSRLWNMC